MTPAERARHDTIVRAAHRRTPGDVQAAEERRAVELRRVEVALTACPDCGLRCSCCRCGEDA